MDRIKQAHTYVEYSNVEYNDGRCPIDVCSDECIFKHICAKFISGYIKKKHLYAERLELAKNILKEREHKLERILNGKTKNI